MLSIIMQTQYHEQTEFLFKSKNDQHIARIASQQHEEQLEKSLESFDSALIVVCSDSNTLFNSKIKQSTPGQDRAGDLQRVRLTS